MTEEEINDLEQYILYIETEKAKLESAVLRLKILRRSIEFGEKIQEILNEISKDYVYDPIMNSVTLSGGWSPVWIVTFNFYRGGLIGMTRVLKSIKKNSHNFSQNHLYKK
jgi:hypothetical protein